MDQSSICQDQCETALMPRVKVLKTITRSWLAALLEHVSGSPAEAGTLPSKYDHFFIVSVRLEDDQCHSPDWHKRIDQRVVTEISILPERNFTPQEVSQRVEW